jgi:hypothetical protein
MKRFITLTFSLLFSAGIVFGQNSTSTNQSGTDNVIHINQSPGKNKAAAFQNGVFNVINIDQMYKNKGPLYQNAADVSQNGDYNKVKRLHQDGSDNEFDVTQNGDHNIIKQYPDQGDTHGASWEGSIQITQTGNKNKVWDADQSGWENILTVTSNGDKNVINVEAQVNPILLTQPNVINITQNGNDNAVGGYGKTKPGAYQEGRGNIMNIAQSGGASAGTQKYLPSGGPNDYNNYFFRSKDGGQGLIQLGLGNSLFINQNGPSVIQTVYQNGKGNHAEITQTGAGNTAASYQVGLGNRAIITQSN